jgi:hypothetical protein
MMHRLTKIMCAMLILCGADLKSSDSSDALKAAIGIKDCVYVGCLACCLVCLGCLSTPLQCVEECCSDCASSDNEDDDIENGLIRLASEPRVSRKME